MLIIITSDAAQILLWITLYWPTINVIVYYYYYRWTLLNTKNKNLRYWRCTQAISRTTSHQTYILIGHLPVWPLSVRHHFPHDDPVTPHVAGWGELPVCDRLRSRPANGNLPALWQRARTFTRWSINFLSDAVYINTSCTNDLPAYKYSCSRSKVLF